MVDLDVGEMFYKFQLSSVLAKYCGVDLGSYMGHNNYRLGTSLETFKVESLNIKEEGDSRYNNSGIQSDLWGRWGMYVYPLV